MWGGISGLGIGYWELGGGYWPGGTLCSVDELLTGWVWVGMWDWWRLPCCVVIPNASFAKRFYRGALRQVCNFPTLFFFKYAFLTQRIGMNLKWQSRFQSFLSEQVCSHLGRKWTSVSLSLPLMAYLSTSESSCIIYYNCLALLSRHPGPDVGSQLTLIWHDPSCFTRLTSFS